MDEERQMLGALINVQEYYSWKVTYGRQEWISAMECIGASGKQFQLQ